ncbi:MAG: PIN domain-containing protein [Bifidobacteriaceae bacterium]|jgi:toxin-antitoxin system PIN domain toxin|nr:PIN domain-containing protein [Bifidobacteriaceae bacterium]
MKPALLDVNVLVALLDPCHALHEIAVNWLSGTIRAGWSTCAITQNGFVRVVSQPAYPNAVPTQHATAILRSAIADANHHFWPCDIEVCDPRRIRPDYLLGPGQVTDVYLLALATAHGGFLATFDQRITPKAAVGATPENLVVIRAPSRRAGLG